MKKIILFSLLLIGLNSNSKAQLNMTLLGTKSYPFVLSNIWGYVDTLNNEYALVGTHAGLSIVDVTNPALPSEVYTVTGTASNWREVKTKGKYAFVTTEGGNLGLQIVNLTNLPGPITSQYWAPTISGTPLQTIHALHVDGNYLYLYGSNINGGATIIVDVTDPWNPVFVNQYIYPGSGNLRYVHDGIVLNDTMYEGHIYGGFFAAVDVTNKMSPQLIATQSTPNNFTHNTWLSGDHKTLFTTDEVDNSFLAAYDISDLSNIQLKDKIQSNPGSNVIVHNTLVLNDYCVTSWYKDGVVIVDGHRPENLVITGNYDTYPSGAGSGFNGDWGVYPYLPSGNIVVSDINNGLLILGPTYVRASYLEGTVNDSICGTPLSGVLVEILTTSAKDYSTSSGDYKTGVPGSGTYSVRFSKPGYTTKTIAGVTMTATLVTNLNINLYSPNTVSISGQVTLSSGSTPVSNAQVLISNATDSYSFSSDASGNFSSCNVLAGTYNITVGKWGSVTKCMTSQVISTSSFTFPLTLDAGYYDDFVFYFGWTVSGSSANSWERGIPVQTLNGTEVANPGADESTDCGTQCYVTDNGGGGPYDNDVDLGTTILTSPIFDASSMSQAVIHYSRWFYNAELNSNPPNDTMDISISNGTNTVLLERILNNSPGNGTWVSKSVAVPSSLLLTSTMKLLVYTSDANPQSIVEGAIDKLEVSDGFAGRENITVSENILSVSPNPFTDDFVISYSLPENNSTDLMIVVTDISGRKIKAIQLSESFGSIKLGQEFENGIYFISLESAEKSVISTLKVIKMK